MVNQLLLPNTCQVPNVILDEVMPKVSHAEFKVVMAIARKTYGWHKVSDWISLRQLMAMTGVSNRQVIDSVRKLDWLIVTRKRGNGRQEYSLNIDAQTGRLSGELSSPKEKPNSELSSPEMVKSVHQSGELSSPTKPTHKKPTNKTHQVEMPPWLDLETWEAFKEMRVKIRAPLTPKAESLTIRTLERLRKEGHDPTRVLEQSIERSWRGVFPIARDKGEGPSGPSMRVL